MNILLAFCLACVILIAIMFVLGVAYVLLGGLVSFLHKHLDEEDIEPAFSIIIIGFILFCLIFATLVTS